MLILVDGPDCARKSTLVSALVARLRDDHPADRVDTYHAGPPRGHPLDEYVVPLLGYRSVDDARHVICDRWYLGEAVYPTVLGRATRLDAGVRAYVELFLRSRGALLVVVVPPEVELRNCLERRGDELIDVETIGAVREGFLDAASATTLPLVWLKDESIDRYVVYQIIEEAHASAVGAAPLAQHVTYVGPRHPRRLLLGDVRAVYLGGDLRPAFMPYPATSGHYLLNTLATDPRFADVGLANACDVDDVRKLLADLDPDYVVGLGRNAQRALASHDARARGRGLPTSRWAPHPQYWRRFHHHERDAYRALVLDDGGSA